MLRLVVLNKQTMVLKRADTHWKRLPTVPRRYKDRRIADCCHRGKPKTEGFSNTAYNTLMHTRAELIDSVMVDGKFVIRNGTCTTVDEAALEKAYAEILRRVYASHLA